MNSPASRNGRIATVAGLAALAAQQAATGEVIHFAGVNNLDLAPAMTSPMMVDLDSDGQYDFGIGAIFNNAPIVILTTAEYPDPALEYTRIVGDQAYLDAEGLAFSHAFAPGSSWDGTVDGTTTTFFDDEAFIFAPELGVAPTDLYVGFIMGINSAPYHGYLHFYFPSTTSLEGALLVSAALETEAGTPIVMGTVPEPDTLVLTFTALGGLVFLRRRKS